MICHTCLYSIATDPFKKKKSLSSKKVSIAINHTLFLIIESTHSKTSNPSLRPFPLPDCAVVSAVKKINLLSDTLKCLFSHLNSPWPAARSPCQRWDAPRREPRLVKLTRRQSWKVGEEESLPGCVGQTGSLSEGSSSAARRGVSLLDWLSGQIIRKEWQYFDERGFGGIEKIP